MQQVIKKFSWAGEIKNSSNDFLMVVHTNIGGGKTDRVIDNIIEHNVEIDENGEIKPAYFAKDSALNKFIEVVENTDAKFFMASDSQDVKEMFKKRFPDKIVTIDNTLTLTYD